MTTDQTRLQLDSERLPALLARISTISSERLAGLAGARVAQSAQAAQATAHPVWQADGIGAEAVLSLFQDTIAPQLSASAGPRFLGFVTGGSTPAAMMGDWLATVYDQNPVSKLDGAAALQLERDTVAMLRGLFGLPDAFAGTLVSGATMSNFVGLAVAREWAGRAQGVRVSDAGVGAARINVFSATPHSSAVKALSMLGLGRQACRIVACLPDREAMDMAALEHMLGECNGPCIVIASAGTVNTGDFDDFAALARLKDKHGFYLHVDAAFGGFAAASPELAPLLAGWTSADSICIDLHKWLNVPYDSAVAFTRHRDLQLDVFSNMSAYLGRSADEPEPIHLAPENSHRWRALPAWFTLLAYGVEGHREIVERNCRLARMLAERMRRSPHFDLLAPARLNIVCFALHDRAATPAYIEAVRDDGRTFVTPTMLRGAPAIRAAFSNWRTTEADLDRVWEALVSVAGKL